MFLEGYETGEFDNCIIGIRGEYGSGKTHLLRWAQSWFAERNDQAVRGGDLGPSPRSEDFADSSQSEEASESPPTPEEATESLQTEQALVSLRPGSLQHLDNVCIYTNSTGRNFLDYFVRQLISQFKQEFLVELMHVFLGRVAAEEAEKLSVTKEASERLKMDYREVKNLLDRDVLPTTRIIETARRALTRYGDDGEIAKVFDYLLDPRSSSPAYRWLIQGPKVSSDDLQTLGMKRRLDTDELAIKVVRLLAQVFKKIGLRWVILVDQLEQLMQQEEIQGRMHIQSAFKDLAGIMSNSHVLIIAGHYSGWRVKPDFYGRFLSPIIEIPHLSDEEIRKIVTMYLDQDEAPGLGELAHLLSEFARGNIRTLLLVCHRLYKKFSERFQETDRTDVEQAFEEIRHLRDQGALRDNLASHLRTRGIRFEPDVRVEDVWECSFAIPDARKPALLVAVVEAIEATGEAGSLRWHVDRASIAREKTEHPRVLFVLTGYVSSEYLKTLEHAGFDAMDATDRSFDTQIVEYLDGLEVTLKGGQATAERRDMEESRIQKVLDQFQKSEAERKAERQAFEDRLAELTQWTEKAQRLSNRLEVVQTETKKAATDAVKPESVLPDIDRFKYVGLIPKLVLILSVIAFTAAVATPYYWIGKYFPFGDFGLINVVLGSLVTGLMSTVAFVTDWMFVDRVRDRLLSKRRLDLLEDVDLYRIFKREQEVLQVLHMSSMTMSVLSSRRIGDVLSFLDSRSS